MTSNRSASASLCRVQTDDEQVMVEPSGEFVSTEQVEELTFRALTYLNVGYPVHFAGVAGTGKTTLAFHVASKLGRPVSLIHGNDEFTSSDLIGKDYGFRKTMLVDNYIHSVMKTDEEIQSLWVDNRLTTACQKGHTLIYDEFNRSRPETNNTLLSVLAEKILNLPKLRYSGEGYLNVHPEFRVIFTSNPEEYAGVHKAQDALMDRLITVKLTHYDRETEIKVTVAKSGIDYQNAEVVVDIVRAMRDIGVTNHRPTIRACIAIAKVLVYRKADVRLDDPVFQWVIRDVLTCDTIKITRKGESIMRDKVEEVMHKVCALHECNG